MKNYILLTAAFMIAGCTTTAAEPELSEKAAERLAGFTQTGEMRACISLPQIESMNAIDDYHFLVETKGGDYYLNTLSSRCAGASRSGNFIKYETSINQLCRGQIITVVDNAVGMTVGSCGLNDFERLEKAPAEEK